MSERYPGFSHFCNIPHIAAPIKIRVVSTAARIYIPAAKFALLVPSNFANATLKIFMPGGAWRRHG